MASSTTTQATTVRDQLNSPTLGKTTDVAQKAPLGEILSAILDVANPSVVVAATTIGAAQSATTGGTVANTGVTTPANASYTQGDQTALANCVLALVVQINLMRTDLLAAITQANKARVDILALRAELASTLAGTVGGATETGVTVTSNAATMAAAASSLISVRATAGTFTGVLQLVTDPTLTLVSGQVFWDGNTALKFAPVDAITTIDILYAKADGSQKVSAFMQLVSP
jgi:hypothetical protein